MQFNITKEDAKKVIYDRLIQMGDYDIEDMLYHIYGRKYSFDFRVVEEYETPDEYGLPLQYRECGPLTVD
jgi:hypothetical protein